MPTLQEIKTGARKTWAEGDYGAIARYLAPASAHLVRVAGVARKETVIDVASGTGVTAITAARAGARVTATDLTPTLLARGEEEAAIAGVNGIVWREADAEELPFEDASFDVGLSSFGHMFTPDPLASAHELMRVVKPGGRIAFTTWPPESAVGQMFKAIGTLLPPPEGAAPPPQWGVPSIVRERLGDGVRNIHFERGSLSWPMMSAGHMWELFSTSYGPFVVALQKLSGEPRKQEVLAANVKGIFEAYFRDNAVHFDYLVTRATRA